jgi:hypothetical protein
MGQVYQCRWRICWEINVFPWFKHHMFNVLYPFVTHLLTLLRNDITKYKNTTYLLYIIHDIIKESFRIFPPCYFLLYYLLEGMYTWCVSDYVRNMWNFKLAEHCLIILIKEAGLTEPILSWFHPLVTFNLCWLLLDYSSICLKEPSQNVSYGQCIINWWCTGQNIMKEWFLLCVHKVCRQIWMLKSMVSWVVTSCSAGFLLHLLCNPEDAGNMALQNNRSSLNYMSLQHRRLYSS